VGYFFESKSIDIPSCALNGHQMTYVRMIMVEAGVIRGGGFLPPVSPQAGLEPTADTLPAEHFMSNSSWPIGRGQAAFIAGRLRRAVSLGVVSDLLGFLDDAPDSADVEAWVEEFAAFNERAAGHDGYFVR
jgi:hypothetical protein